mmetsp:Transcript_14432/g.45866  ORF Transcript_14432/g.45866 Transcript_14432/m.45866 type:complete len:205 (-) Transcript_14432:184-798(-)
MSDRVSEGSSAICPPPPIPSPRFWYISTRSSFSASPHWESTPAVASATRLSMCASTSPATRSTSGFALSLVLSDASTALRQLTRYVRLRAAPPGAAVSASPERSHMSTSGCSMALSTGSSSLLPAPGASIPPSCSSRISRSFPSPSASPAGGERSAGGAGGYLTSFSPRLASCPWNAALAASNDSRRVAASCASAPMRPATRCE